MHIHLEPVGGVAGDMFCAAMLDLFPEFKQALFDDLSAAGLLSHVEARAWVYRDHQFNGMRFEVRAREHDHVHHRHYTEVRRIVEESGLREGVKHRAIEMFELLARSESQAHGIEVEQVHFHEVGGWDSIIDIACAAWFVDRLGDATYSVTALPLGSGRIKTAHGVIPVPAPATVRLLEGLPVFDDGIAGERVTPTGAVIVRALRPGSLSEAGRLRLRGHGIGFGTKKMPEISNMLRVTAYEEGPDASTADGAAENETWLCDRVLRLEFEIDDQTPEDLAIGLDRLRDLDGVLDVLQWAAYGKKGRQSIHVQVLARAEAERSVVTACLRETTTLGLRRSLSERIILPREQGTAQVEAQQVQVKRATRPGGQVTVKVEMDDVAATGGDHAAREQFRRSAELPDD